MIRRKSVFVFIYFTIVFEGSGRSQDIIENRIEQLESLTEKKDIEPEDDDYELVMEQFSRHPVNINSATEEDLIQLHLLRPGQIRNLMLYKKLLGPLISMHELQAVPGWDVETIRKLLPFVFVGRDESLYSAFRERWKGGDASLLIRSSQIIEKSKGFEKPVDPDVSHYMGSRQKIFMRYSYNYKQLLAFGITGDKDAGEPFFRNPQQYGFDFYSFHFFLQHAGIVRALAIGDFTVNMGQGLIQWQTLAFTKSSLSMAIKREANCLRPYHSAGESNFHRGLGISLQKKKWQMTAFISSRKISTNLEQDTSGREDLFSSIQQSGYHRTASEIADRNNSQQYSAGANVRFSGEGWQLGANCIHYQFTHPFQKREEPYNLYSFRGKKLTNYSMDYSFTRGNLHLFGEIAVDQGMHTAYVQGALLSLGEHLDMSFLYRNISPLYQSLYSDAFTENSVPNNEKGLYCGLAFKPATGILFNIYYDLFVFPWLKYQVDAPSYGNELLIQASYQPNKLWNMTMLFKKESRLTDGEVLNNGTHSMTKRDKQRWRIETEYDISRSTHFISRMEFIWIQRPRESPQKGFLGTAGFSLKKPAFSGNIGATIFDTDNYDSRVYSYEPDLTYNYSLPGYFGKGLHYFISLQRDLSHLIPHTGKRYRLGAGLKWSQTFYTGTDTIGTGLDEIRGNRKSELKVQVLIQWQ